MLSRRTFLSRTVIANAALAAAAVAATTFATSSHAVGNLVDVQLVDRSQSETLPVYPYRGAAWVAGRPGSRYAVRLSNRSAERVLVVLSVDGVNAVSGETAATGQTGYVLAPYQTTEIAGWRKSLTESAAFYFTALPDSYAARTDRPDNVGVVGAAVFREKQREVVRRPFDQFDKYRPYAQRSEHDGAERDTSERESAERKSAAGAANTPAPAAPAQSESRAQAAPSADAAARAKAGGSLRDERLGTGHGEREYAPVTNTAFERASDRPNEIVRLRYDSYQNLVASGVVQPRRHQPQIPDAFPNSPNFVPDPKG